METNNAYQAPASALVDDNEGVSRVLSLKRFSAWGVFFLSIVTLGIYPFFGCIYACNQ